MTPYESIRAVANDIAQHARALEGPDDGPALLDYLITAAASLMRKVEALQKERAPGG